MDTQERDPGLVKLYGEGEPDPLSEKIESLEKQLEAERDCRREDRFLALIIIVIVLDIWMLDKVQNIAVPLIVFVLELMFFLAVAKRMGIQQIAGILDSVLSHFARRPDS